MKKKRRVKHSTDENDRTLSEVTASRHTDTVKSFYSGAFGSFSIVNSSNGNNNEFQPATVIALLPCQDAPG